MKLVQKVFIVATMVLSPLSICMGAANTSNETAPDAPASTKACYQANQQGSMSFDWPRSGKVAVTEQISKKGMVVDMAYDLVIEPAKNHNLRLSYENFELLTFNGEDAKDPKHANAVQAIKTMSQMVPELIVSATGEFVDIDISEQVIDKIMKQMPKQQGKNAPSLSQIRQMLTSPQMQAVQKTKIEQTWNALVGSWVGFPNHPGKKYQCVEQKQAFGGNVTFDISYQQLPSPANKQYSGMTQINFVSSAQPKQAVEAMLKAFASVPKEQQPKFESVKQQSNVSIVTDPKTLRPVSVTTEVISAVQVVGKPANEKVETHRYRFNWK